jgi:hypothetical protein
LESLVVLKLINSFKSTILTAKLWTLSSLILIFDNNKKEKTSCIFYRWFYCFFYSLLRRYCRKNMRCFVYFKL